jgi:hypothetical protein
LKVEMIKKQSQRLCLIDFFLMMQQNKSRKFVDFLSLLFSNFPVLKMILTYFKLNNSVIKY